MRIKLIKDSYESERQLIVANTQNEIADIQKRLADEANLTATARKALNNQIRMLQEQQNRDLIALQNEYYKMDLDAARETQDMQIALMAEGAEKQRAELYASYSRQIEDLDFALKTETGLTEKQTDEMLKQRMLLQQQYAKEMEKLDAQVAQQRLQTELDALQMRKEALQDYSAEYISLSLDILQKQRDLELAANAQKNEDVRQNEADINAKWDAIILKQTTEMTRKRALIILDAQQELNASEFDLLDSNERQKTQFRLEQEKARLQKILELDAAAGVKMTEQERQTIINTIKAIEKESKRLPYNNLYELLGIGLDSDQQSALNTAIDSIKDSVSSLVESWNAAADAALNAANAQVDAAQRALDAEIEARNAGYANEVATAQKELELAKKNQEKAMKEKERLNRHN